MKTLKVLILGVLVLMLAGCDTGSSGAGGSAGGGTISPPSQAAPIDAPPAAPIAAAPSCSPFVGTHWVLNGKPSLTPFSQDQTGQAPYVAEFNLTGNSPTFTENQWVGAGTISCTRNFSDGVEFGNPTSLVWGNITTGPCSAVAQWIEFDASQCNILSVTIRDGLGEIYETATYIPQ